MNRRQWLRNNGMLAAASFLLPGYAPVTYPSFNHKQVNQSFTKLNANENPYGFSPKAMEAYKKGEKLGNRYAFHLIPGLKEAIAELHGCEPANVLIGPGSSALLQQIGLYMVIRGGDISTCNPTFDILPMLAEKFSTKVHRLPLKTNHSYDLEGLLSSVLSNPGMAYIVNPNNPIGHALAPTELQSFCREVAPESITVIDEAYLEFADPEYNESMISQATQAENIIVTKTLSKIYGMAGLRIGYAISNPALVSKVEETQIFPGIQISHAAYLAAVEGLKDQEYIRQMQENNTLAKQKVYQLLKLKDLDYIPSQGCFVLFDISSYDGDFQEDMKSQGVLIGTRDYLGKKWCRVSMGTPEEMDIFLDAMKSVMG